MDSEIESKVKQYENFISVLKEDLKDVEKQLDNAMKKYNEWDELYRSMKVWRTLKGRDVDMLVPLGFDVNVNATADVDDRILVDIGLGCLLEMNYDEAEKYSTIRMRASQREIDHFRNLAVKVKVNIKLTLLAINELTTASGGVVQT